MRQNWVQNTVLESLFIPTRACSLFTSKFSVIFKLFCPLQLHCVWSRQASTCPCSEALQSRVTHVGAHVQRSSKICPQVPLQTSSTSIKTLIQKKRWWTFISSDIWQPPLQWSEGFVLTIVAKMKASSTHFMCPPVPFQNETEQRETGTCSRCCSPAGLPSLFSAEGA